MTLQLEKMIRDTGVGVIINPVDIKIRHDTLFVLDNTLSSRVVKTYSQEGVFISEAIYNSKTDRIFMIKDNKGRIYTTDSTYHIFLYIIDGSDTQKIRFDGNICLTKNINNGKIYVIERGNNGKQILYRMTENAPDSLTDFSDFIKAEDIEGRAYIEQFNITGEKLYTVTNKKSGDAYWYEFCVYENKTKRITSYHKTDPWVVSSLTPFSSLHCAGNSKYIYIISEGQVTAYSLDKKQTIVVGNPTYTPGFHGLLSLEEDAKKNIWIYNQYDHGFHVLDSAFNNIKYLPLDKTIGFYRDFSIQDSMLSIAAMYSKHRIQGGTAIFVAKITSDSIVPFELFTPPYGISLGEVEFLPCNIWMNNNLIYLTSYEKGHVYAFDLSGDMRDIPHGSYNIIDNLGIYYRFNEGHKGEWGKQTDRDFSSVSRYFPGKIEQQFEINADNDYIYKKYKDNREFNSEVQHLG